MTATAAMMIQDKIQTSQNRFHIAGHSLKKCESYEFTGLAGVGDPMGREVDSPPLP
jgi:hypothetical protein